MGLYLNNEYFEKGYFKLDTKIVFHSKDIKEKVRKMRSFGHIIFYPLRRANIEKFVGVVCIKKARYNLAFI
jgi:hypothetical protein